MTVRRLIASIALATSLAACATAPATEGQSLAAAQDAVAAALQGVHLAYAQGIVPKANVIKAAKLGDQADDASIAARRAYAAGDASTAAGMVQQIGTLATEIVALERPSK
jgi:hypothetical protein